MFEQDNPYNIQKLDKLRQKMLWHEEVESEHGGSSLGELVSLKDIMLNQSNSSREVEME